MKAGRSLRICVHGQNPPGRACGPHHNVHVGLQVGTEPHEVVPASAEHPSWITDTKLIDADSLLDFRGPAVHGKRGERFLYLTWGEVGADGSFEMFRRAKLILSRVDPALVIEAAASEATLVATVDLTDNTGMPRCARVDPPAIEWHIEHDPRPQHPRPQHPQPHGRIADRSL